jgi:excinuclease ABC subunit C
VSDKPLPYGERIWTGFVGDRTVLAEKAKEAPDSPGAYVYRDRDGAILYVGKAISLRKRLRSYFAQNLPPKTEALMEKAARLETITVDSEKEALILELNLIKKHRPRYNIILRDDKQYPYIRVGIRDQWPRVTIVRRPAKDGARYFGPFTRAGAVRETLFLLRRIFPFRSCTDRALAQTTRPCLDYHIGRCLGPCTGKLDQARYRATIDEVVKFLEGRLKEVRQSLEERMAGCAERMEFEAAARLRDQIKSLDDVTERQRITAPDMKDRDVLGLARARENAFVALLPVREGKLLGKEGFILSGAADREDSDILEAFISQYYSAAPFFPAEILVPRDLRSVPELEDILKEQRKASQGREGAVRIRLPKRGKLRELLAIAEENAGSMMSEYVPREEREAEANRKAMEDLASAIGMRSLPSRIEGYDISNITGKEAVASMVVFKDGKPEKSAYRRFKMKMEGKPNDFAMMQEVLWRRFKKGLAEPTLPDLVLVDGGKGQVSAAKDVLDELRLDLPLAGLAKRNEEIFLPGQSDPVALSRDSGALYLVMRLRDEAHRFAVAYHRKLRGEKAVRSALLDIPGVGPAKVKELLTVFPNIETLRKAPLQEVAKVKGIGPSLARRILDRLNGRDANSSSPY